MKNELIKREFSEALLGIYNLDITKMLIHFLQGEQAVLFALSVGGMQNPSELSEKLGLTRSRMSMILTSLSKKEQILLATDPNDRRRTNVELTKSGKLYVSNKEDEVLSFFDVYLEKMGKDKVIQLINLINETVNHMKAVKL